MQKHSPIQLLKHDGIGILPTDTLYGVVGSALSKKAVERIYAVKGRDENKPFIVLISQIADLKSFGIKISPTQLTYLNYVWPGPVSVILLCPQKKFEYLHRGTRSIAFRMPAQKSLLAFFRQTGPLVAPSANPQGMDPAKTIVEAKKYFGPVVDFGNATFSKSRASRLAKIHYGVDFYVAGGRKDSKPSKIVSFVGGEPVVLRS